MIFAVRCYLLSYWCRTDNSYLSIPQSFIVLGLSLGLIWIFAPWIAYLISRARVSRVPKLRAADLKTIRIIARRIWKYFEDFVTEGDNWLPPDNYQYDPSMGLAHRTSPTNIGSCSYLI